MPELLQSAATHPVASMGSRVKSALLHWTGPPVVLPADVAGPLAVVLLTFPVAPALVVFAPPVPLVPEFVPVAVFAVFAVFAAFVAPGVAELGLELQAHAPSAPTSTQAPYRIFKFFMDKSVRVVVRSPRNCRKAIATQNPTKDNTWPSRCPTEAPTSAI